MKRALGGAVGRVGAGAETLNAMVANAAVNADLVNGTTANPDIGTGEIWDREAQAAVRRLAATAQA